MSDHTFVIEGSVVHFSRQHSFVKVVDRWQLQLPSLSYPRGNYINSRTYACMSACIHQQNTENALITPRGVDWMNFTAEYSSLLPMCLTFVRKVITCLALVIPTVSYSILSLTFRDAIYNNKSINAGRREGEKQMTNLTKQSMAFFEYFCMTAHSLGKLLESDGSFLCGRPIDSFPHMGIPGISLLHMGKEIKSSEVVFVKGAAIHNLL